MNIELVFELEMKYQRTMVNEKIITLRMIKRILLILLIIPGTFIITIGQQYNPEELALISEAQALFDKKDYQAALPHYAQLVSVHPDDPQFNYKFGVCTLFGDRKDKKKPIKYLNNAAQTIKDDQELNYFLGMAYHQNQEFANAIKFFNLYLSKLQANSPERPIVLEKVNACLNGLNLADKNLISEIISTSKFQRENFHRAYAAQDFNGSLVIKPEIFISEKEKKSGENSYVFLIHPSNVLYFSSYSKSDATNRDIFKAEIDENGDWGAPVKLSETINTSFDEDYPVLVDNGTTLYFCSKGHNSLGGYDIFRSVLDESTNTFSPPENLGPGINSPFDDIEFIPTRDKSYVYFASDRDNLNGSVSVYKAKLSDNAFSGNLYFAKGNGLENLPKTVQSSGNSQVNKNEISNTGNDEVIVQNEIKQPSSYASEKAASILNDRAKSMALADSAFAKIAATKELIRELTNKRDRANAISQRKADEAKTLEARFNESIALLANTADEKQFLEDLDKSIKLKQELYQLQQRASQANKIAWNLGNQVKAKNQEMNTLKTLASKIQATSVTGSFEETLVQFTKYKNVVAVSDTLKDYSELVMAITNDKTTYNVPDSELAFAENLKKAYKSSALMAQNIVKKPAFDENAPVVIVDKRTPIQPSGNTESQPKQTLIAYAQVEPVLFSATNFTSTDPGNEQLIIDFKIDSYTRPLPLVQLVNYSGLSDLTVAANENIEVSFRVDELASNEIYALIEPIYFKTPVNSFEPDEANLALNFNVDAVRPAELVKQIDIAAKDLALNDEDIEIGEFPDVIESVNVTNLVEQVQFRETTPDVTDTELELSFAADLTEPYKLIQQLKVATTGDQKNLPDETLEITSYNDNQPDQVIALAIEPVAHNEIGNLLNLENEEIDLRFNVDKTVALNLITPVSYNPHSSQPETEPEIEVDSKVDETMALNQVNPVYYKAGNTQLETEPEIEVDSQVDATIALGIISPINFTGNQSQKEATPELEIDSRVDETLALNLVNPVYYKAGNKQSETEPEIEVDSEVDAAIALGIISPIYYTGNQLQKEALPEIEIDSSIDESKAIAAITPVSLPDFTNNTLDPGDEKIETGTDAEKKTVEAYNIIQQVAYEEPVTLLTDSDPAIEINFLYDRPVKTYKLLTPVYLSMNYYHSESFIEEPIEIDLGDEYNTTASLLSNEMTTQSVKMKVANSVSKPTEQTFGDNVVVSDDGLFYLREAVMQAIGIESSRSDDEILARALNNPDDLTYEELIYAANLTDVQEQKMAILKVAFVHIDRDWRAFNNAGVSAIHLDDLSMAGCYLYQASLLSANNGNIQNNLGILACHQNQVDKAADYFVAASKLGYDSKYNLNIMNTISKIEFAEKNTKEAKVIKAEKSEDAVVDIIDYNTNP